MAAAGVVQTARLHGSSDRLHRRWTSLEPLSLGTTTSAAAVDIAIVHRQTTPCGDCSRRSSNQAIFHVAIDNFFPQWFTVIGGGSNQKVGGPIPPLLIPTLPSLPSCSSPPLWIQLGGLIHNDSPASVSRSNKNQMNLRYRHAASCALCAIHRGERSVRLSQVLSTYFDRRLFSLLHRAFIFAWPSWQHVATIDLPLRHFLNPVFKTKHREVPLF